MPRGQKKAESGQVDLGTLRQQEARSPERGNHAWRGRPAGGRALSHQPAEPSPILMTGERARGQEIGAGSCGSGDSAASRRAAAGGGGGGGGSGPRGRGCADPAVAPGVRMPGTAPAGGAGHCAPRRGQRRAGACDSEQVGLGGGQAGSRTKRLTRDRAGPPQGTACQARGTRQAKGTCARPGPAPPSLDLPAPRRPGPARTTAAESESLIKTTPQSRAALFGLLLFCSLISFGWYGQCGWNLFLPN